MFDPLWIGSGGSLFLTASRDANKEKSNFVTALTSYAEANASANFSFFAILPSMEGKITFAALLYIMTVNELMVPTLFSNKRVSKFYSCLFSAPHHTTLTTLTTLFCDMRQRIRTFEASTRVPFWNIRERLFALVEIKSYIAYLTFPTVKGSMA